MLSKVPEKMEMNILVESFLKNGTAVSAIELFDELLLDQLV